MNQLCGVDSLLLAQNKLVKDFIKTTEANFPFLKLAVTKKQGHICLDYLTGNLNLVDTACYNDQVGFDWRKE